jgi:hypothetical protein
LKKVFNQLLLLERQYPAEWQCSERIQGFASTIAGNYASNVPNSYANLKVGYAARFFMVMLSLLTRNLQVVTFLVKVWVISQSQR